MTTVTTKQVRAVIAKFAPAGSMVFTNKTRDDRTANRRVKCYYHNNVALLKALQKLAGKENVYITEGGESYYSNTWGPGLIVKCVLG